MKFIIALNFYVHFNLILLYEVLILKHIQIISNFMFFHECSLEFIEYTIDYRIKIF